MRLFIVVSSCPLHWPVLTQARSETDKKRGRNLKICFRPFSVQFRCLEAYGLSEKALRDAPFVASSYVLRYFKYTFRGVKVNEKTCSRKTWRQRPQGRLAMHDFACSTRRTEQPCQLRHKCLFYKHLQRHRPPFIQGTAPRYQSAKAGRPKDKATYRLVIREPVR